MPKYFYRSPEIDDKSIKNQITEGSSGAHRFFRASGPLMQKRFTEIVDCTFAPKILIHGNPHVANYCKTSRGASMVDFDRSRLGPYSYDIVRFLVSLSLSGPEDDNDFLHPVVIDHFRRGYLYGLFANKRYEHEEMHELRTQEPRRWQRNTSDYLESRKKWAKKLFDNEVELNRRRSTMLKSYLESIEDQDLSAYVATSCAEVAGSMGKIHHLYLLQDPAEKLEPILIDIKEVYKEEDNDWFSNPFEHHGKRMNAAGKIYAPGWEQMPGHASYKNEQYWGRQIPTQQVKLAAPIEPIDQCDLCFSVAAQLGKGHSKASKKYSAKDIFADFKKRLPEYLKAAEQIQKELLCSYDVYCAEVTLSKHGIRKIS